MKTTRKVLSLVLSLAMVISMLVSWNITVQAAENGLYVNGTTLYDGNGNELILRGVNVPHAWYSGYTHSSIKAIASLGANSVRVVCATGSQWGKTSYSDLQSIINTCRNLGLICVLEVHDYTGYDSVSSLNDAVNYWKEMKNLLNANKDYVIVNIANEWLGTWNLGSTWSSAYQDAVKNLRNAGIENVLMVDGPGYGQETAPLINYCQQVASADSTGNIMFSIHMYSVAGANASVIKSNIDNTLSKGVCLCIGEFGDYQNGGDVDELTVMSYCEQKNVGYMAWSWKGNSGGDENLDLSYDWYSANSLSTWGKTVFYDTNGIQNTSVLAYTGAGSIDTDVATDIAGCVDTKVYEAEKYVANVNTGSAKAQNTLGGYSGVGYAALNNSGEKQYIYIPFTAPETARYTFSATYATPSQSDIYFDYWTTSSSVSYGEQAYNGKTYHHNNYMSLGTGSSSWSTKTAYTSIKIEKGETVLLGLTDNNGVAYFDKVTVTASAKIFPEGTDADTDVVIDTDTATETETEVETDTATEVETDTATEIETDTENNYTPNGNRYEFEYATLGGNATVSAPYETVSSASNGKLVQFNSGANDAQFNVNIEENGKYAVKFVAVGLGGYTRNIQFFIDNTYTTEILPSSDWTEFTYEVELSKGTHVIGAKTDGAWGWQWEWSYIDYVEITKLDTTVDTETEVETDTTTETETEVETDTATEIETEVETDTATETTTDVEKVYETTLEIEDIYSSSSTNVVKETAYKGFTNYTGNGYMRIDRQGKLEFSINAEVDGTYSFSLKNTAGSARKSARIEICKGNQVVYSQDFKSGTAYTWENLEFTADLTAGNYTVKISCPQNNSYNVLVDSITFKTTVTEKVETDVETEVETDTEVEKVDFNKTIQIENEYKTVSNAAATNNYNRFTDYTGDGYLRINRRGYVTLDVTVPESGTYTFTIVNTAGSAAKTVRFELLDGNSTVYSEDFKTNRGYSWTEHTITVDLEANTTYTLRLSCPQSNSYNALIDRIEITNN